MSYPQGPQYGQPQQQPGYPQQQPGYPAQQGDYPQPGGYPPGYPPPPPPGKNNTALIVTLAGVAAAAVIALVLVLTLSGKDESTNTADSGTIKPGGGNVPAATLPGPGKTRSSGAGSGSAGSGSAGSARALAEKAVSVIESHSTSLIDGLACTSTAASQLKRELGKVPVGATATLTEVKESGTQAQAFMKVSMGSQSESFTMEMQQDGSKWCVSGI
jgi:hypothetical protein